jgi:hypothetical protein
MTPADMAESKPPEWYRFELNGPGPFLMPPLSRIEKFYNQPNQDAVWVQASSSAGGRALVGIFRPVCVSLVEADQQDRVLHSRDLAVEMLGWPSGVKVVQFPVLCEYKGVVTMNQTGWMLEFACQHGKSIVLSISSVAYKSLLSHLKKSLPQAGG